MYLRQSKQTRADGSTLSHLQIAESVWDLKDPLILYMKNIL